MQEVAIFIRSILVAFLAIATKVSCEEMEKNWHSIYVK